MGVAEVLGATLVLRTAAKFMGDSIAVSHFQIRRNPGESYAALIAKYTMHKFADEPSQTILPRIGFAEALQDMVDRTPVTIRNAAERTASRIARLYNEGRVVAFVKSAEEAVTAKVQQVIAQALGTGATEINAAGFMVAGVDEVREFTEAWSESYSRMVFRTNVNTAVSQGRIQQATDPDIIEVTPALAFTTAGPPLSQGGDTRENHHLMNGVIMRSDNPLWQRFKSPLGYNCRCQLRLMSVPQLRRMNRLDENGRVIESPIPAGAGPDPGFR